MPEVSVVVPSRGAAATLPRTLTALERQTLGREDVEVVVVDDGAAGVPATTPACAVRVVRTPGVGPGQARNAGVAAASAAVIAFTDADCFPEPGWLERALAALEHADLVQGAVLPERPPGPYDRTVWVTGPSGLFETANLVVRRALFEELGGFRPGLRPRGGKELGEDVELGWRARRAGARVAFAADAVVRHAVAPRGPAGYVADRARLVAFPALAARVPELRRTAFWRPTFLTARSAAFDAAVAGVALRRRGGWPAAVPYAAMVVADARTRGVEVAAVRAAADGVGALALAAGSLRHRSLLL